MPSSPRKFVEKFLQTYRLGAFKDEETLIDEVAARDAEAQREIAELQQTFDLIHDADMRGIVMWRKANPGNDLVQPDRAKMIFWLLEQNAALQAQIDAAMALANRWKGKHEYGDQLLAALAPKPSEVQPAKER